MKKRLLYFSLFLLIGSFIVSAKQITEVEALGIANGFTKNVKLKSNDTNVKLKLAYVNQDANDVNFYVFNKGDNEGYIFVSGEDCTDAILGYTDNGRFDYDNIPENMKVWLSSYSNEIRHARKVNITVAESKATTWDTSVAPLVQSKWDQGSPYNNMCPVLSDGSNAATGCVATAMAQIMYYHKWPVTGIGSKSYSKNGFTLSADFGNTTYQWDAMTPTYSSSSTAEANNAVATLMYHCGVAAEMGYGNSSGAQTPTAVSGMLKYLGYDDEARLLTRNYYGRTEWEQILKSELDAGRPVMYGGETGTNEGHQFVCDGYDTNGMFHINWGWGGISDGYFKITALSPENQGIGGSSSGFNYDQDMVIGIQRPNGVSNPIPYSIFNQKFNTNYTSINKNESFSFNISYLKNLGYDAFDGIIGVGVFDYKTNKMIAAMSPSKSLSLKSFNYYKSYYVDAIVPSNIEDGTYKLFVITRATGSTEWIVSNSILGAPMNIMTVTGTKAVFSQSESIPKLTVSNITYDKAYKNKKFNVKCDITNSGDEYYSILNVKIIDKDTKQILYTGADVKENIPNGKTLDLNFVEKITNLNAGNYLLTIVDDEKNQLCTPIDFTLYAEPTDPVLSVVSMSFNDATKVPKDNFELTAKIANTGGLFNDKIFVVIWNQEGEYVTTAMEKVFRIDTTDGSDVAFSGPIDLNPGTYIAALYIQKGSLFSEMDGNNWKAFTLVEGSGVISTIENQPSEVTIYPNPAESIVNIKANGKIDAVRVFDMSGRMLIDEPSIEQVDISDLSKGNYLMQIVIEGKAEMKALIKK